jgi:glutaconate CoA-transferase subunit A
MDQRSNKIMPLTEAVAKFISDGDMVVNANFLSSIPYAIIHEIIRQGKKNLTGVSCSSIEELDQMLSVGCLSKIITSYYHRAGGKTYKRELDRALKDKRVQLEDYSNFTVMSMLMAGAMGYSFVPALKSVKESDIFRLRTFKGDNKIKTIPCPFTGEETVVVPALNPDVAIVHVQRCDELGNAQYWGSEGTVKWSALAAKKIIVSCEELVEHEKIKRSPFLTVIPGFRVNAVCVEPMGAHPSPVAGYYNHDNLFRASFFSFAFGQAANEKFISEWILDRKDRKDYIDHYISRFGQKPLEILKVNEYMSDSVNMGYKNKYWRGDFCDEIALTRDEYEKKTEELGELEL